MTDAPVVGSAAFELRAKREQLKKDLADAERDLKQATGQMEAEANKSAGGISRSMRGIGVAVTAVLAVFTAAAAGALTLGRASLQMADDIANGAKRIGIGTDALQEWRYVAKKTGEDAQAVDGALESFSNKFAAAAAGLSKADLKNFQSIGLSQDDLRRLGDTESALDEVIDRVSALRNESDRAAIAERLGLSPLVSALREGSDEVARLRDEARELGIVMDAELIQKGAAASEKLDIMSKIIGVQMAEAFIGLSDEVLTFTGYIADALRGLNSFLGKFDEWKQKLRFVYGDDFMESLRRGDAAGVSRSVIEGWRTGRIAAAAEAYNDPQYESPDDPALLRQRMAVEDYRTGERRPPRRSSTFNPTLTIPSTPDTSAQRAAEREARRAERVQEEITRAKARALQIEQDDLLTVQERYDLHRRELQIDRAGEDADLQSRLARKDLTKAEFDQLTAQNTINRGLEDRISQDQLGRDLADERLGQERALADLTAQLLSLQSGAARTAAERRRIELAMLEDVQRRRREDLETRAAREKWSPDRLRDGLSTLDRIDQGERDAVGRSTMGPLEAWRDRSLATAGEIAEAYENVAARGLDSLNDGLVDAIMNTRSLGDIFSSVTKQILADLLSIGIRQSFIQPLANFLFGDGKSKGSQSSGFLSALSSMFGGFKFPGFANGVTNFSGGLAYVHQGELLANLAPGTSVIPANVVNGMGGGGDTYHINGNLLTPEWWAMIDGKVAQGEARAVRTSAGIGRRSAPALNQTLRRMGTT